MIPVSFEYLRPSSLEEAVNLLVAHGDDAKILAGGHSLVPAMKLRLAQPATVIDIGRVAGLDFIRATGGQIALGPMVTHHAIETSELLGERCPLLPLVACEIGDVQVRNRGTLGGSLVHADPASDWPAAILALEAEIDIVGPTGRRVVKAADFFVDMMETAVQPNEILCEIRVPMTSSSVAYEKFAQKASGFAIAGVAAMVDAHSRSVRVGVTGVAAAPYRASAVESELEGKDLTRGLIAQAAEKTSEGVEALGDIHASAEFRAHLARVHARRALERATGLTS